MLYYENQARARGYPLVVGLDEAGRGPLAGPVVAAAVCLKSDGFESTIADSKKLTAARRERAFHEILEKSHVGIGIISEVVIDEINILNATYHAMNNAVRHLCVQVTRGHRSLADLSKEIFLLIDGNRFQTDLPYHYKTVVGADGVSLSVAAASIVAKVVRDRILATYDRIFPQYGFRQHKGYPTAAHKQAIKRFGPSLIHRRSFQWQ